MKERKKKEQTKEKGSFCIQILVASSFFFRLLRFQHQMLHVIHRRVREHALTTYGRMVYLYVGKMMNKQRIKKKCKFLVCTLISYQSRNKLWQLLFNRIEENKFLSLTLVKCYMEISRKKTFLSLSLLPSFPIELKYVLKMQKIQSSIPFFSYQTFDYLLLSILCMKCSRLVFCLIKHIYEVEVWL